jgi:HlyD family secretion protein
VLVLAVVGVGVVIWARRGGTAEIEVRTATVEEKDLVAHVLANGKLQPRNKVDISANIAGQIVNLAVREGDRVEEGDFLLQIDKAQYEATAESSEANLQSLLHDRDAARANLEQARYEFEKAQRSYEDRLIPETEFQRARSALEAGEAGHRAAQGRVDQARASLEGARDSLRKTTIRAPLSGIVTALPVHEGEVAVIGTMNNPGTVLMTISDLSAMEADLAVDETDIPRLAVGQKAELTVDAYPDETFEGLVREVGSSPIRPGTEAAERTGTVSTEAIDFEVRVSVVEPVAGMRPGFSVSAEIEVGRAAAVPAVPIQSLVTRETSSSSSIEEGVYVVQDGRVRFAPLTIGLSGAQEVEVIEGVSAGEEIVIGPFRALRELADGAAVRILADEEGEPAEGETSGS